MIRFDPLALFTIAALTVPAVFSMWLKLRLPQNSNPIAPTIFSLTNRYRITPPFFNRLKTRGPSGDPIAKTAFSTLLGCSQFRVETEPAVLAN